MTTALLSAILMLVPGTGGWTGASAHPNGTMAVLGSFEVDGNLADNTGPGEPLDWATLPAAAVTNFTDGTGRGDDSFGLGSKELEPAAWVCKNGSVPGKDDIRAGQIGFRVVNGKQFMYVNYTRAAVNGDAHIDYEFSQSALPNPSCPDLPMRTAGDIVVTFDTENGGADIFVRAFRWVGDATTGTFQELPLGAHGANYDGAVNIPNTIPGHKAGDFGEAVLNLTDTIGSITCGQFAKAYMKTRASTAINSALKDRTGAQAAPGPCPKLSLEKSGAPSAVAQGDNVTFTITVANDANATGSSQGAVVSDTLPAGTTFVGCTGGCTGPDANGKVTWTLGPIAPGGSVSVTLTLKVDAITADCKLCNTATVDDPQTPASPDAAGTGCITLIPVANPAGATARGNATGARVSRPSAPALAVILPDGDDGPADQTSVDSTQSGVGTASESESVENSSVDLDPTPPNPSTELTASLISASASSTVTASPGRATQTSVAEAADVCVQRDNVTGNCLVRASLVRGVATAEATGSSSAFRSTGSAIEGLVVNGKAVTTIKPNDRIDLKGPAFGSGSYVSIFERTGTVSRPAAGQKSGGTYAADLAVSMIRVHLTDNLSTPLVDESLDVTVASAVAHADFPQTAQCLSTVYQKVSGHAFVASQSTEPPLLPVMVGYSSIPETGGDESQDLFAVDVPGDGSGVTASNAYSRSFGELAASASNASSEAGASSVCVLPVSGVCTVSANLVKSKSSTTASAGGTSSNDTGTELVGLVVAGTPIANTPAPNTVIDLPGGLGYVVLNEQYCDGQSPPLTPGPVTCGGNGISATGRTVRAIHVVLLPTGTTNLVEIIVAEAHSDATYQ